MQSVYKDNGEVKLNNAEPFGDYINKITHKPPRFIDDRLNVVIDGALIEKPQSEIDAIEAARAAATATETTRLDAIEAAQESEGLRQYTLDQADEYLQDKLDLTELNAATDLATAKVAIKKLMIAIYQIHMKEMPYILRPMK